MNAWPADAQPELCVGRVFHKRFRPVQHQFSYNVFFLRLPLSRMKDLGNRWLTKDGFNLLSFATRDYGPPESARTQRECCFMCLLFVVCCVLCVVVVV